MVATNSQGDSDISAPGSGAQIWVEPGVPQNLQQVPWSSDSELRIKWEAPLESGGSPVLDYSVFSVELESGQGLAVVYSGIT